MNVRPDLYYLFLWSMGNSFFEVAAGNITATVHLSSSPSNFVRSTENTIINDVDAAQMRACHGLGGLSRLL